MSTKIQPILDLNAWNWERITEWTKGRKAAGFEDAKKIWDENYKTITTLKEAEILVAAVAKKKPFKTGLLFHGPDWKGLLDEFQIQNPKMRPEKRRLFGR